MLRQREEQVQRHQGKSMVCVVREEQGDPYIWSMVWKGQLGGRASQKVSLGDVGP